VGKASINPFLIAFSTSLICNPLLTTKELTEPLDIPDDRSFSNSNEVKNLIELLKLDD
jgi:hypothetical protein